MRTFKHLTVTKRIQLESLIRAKVPKRKIAEILNIHISPFIEN